MLVDVPETAKVCAEEVFAPVVGLDPFDDFDEALARGERLGRTGCRRACSRATCSARSTAFDALEVGGVIVNDVPTWRIDHMPYGGVKDSGLGREGPRYAIEEMTEPKLFVINRERTQRLAAHGLRRHREAGADRAGT